MENARYIGYLITVALVFVVFAAIKMVMPHKEAKKPVDVIGMQLYRPIFFGTDEDRKLAQVTDAQEESYQSEVFVEEKAEEPKAVTPTPKPKAVKTETTTKPVVPKSSDDDEAYFSQFLIDYKENVQSKRKYRNDVVVRYYRHASDGTRADVLVGYGFYLHIRPIENQEHYEKYSSNVMYYGKEFPERDIKLIAYLLIQNGIGIKKIAPFKDYDGWKRKSIEIGANAKLQKEPVLTLSHIRNFKRAE